MLKATLLRLRVSRAKLRGVSNRADDVFDFFSSAPGRGSIGLDELSIEPFSSGRETNFDDRDSEDGSGAGFCVDCGVTRIAPDAQLATAIAHVYDPVVYAYGLFDFVCIEEAMRARLAVAPGVPLTVPLLSPYALIHHPQVALRQVGPSYQTSLTDTLCALLTDHDLHAPGGLVRCVRALLGADAVAPPIAAHADDEANASLLQQEPPSADMTSFLRGLLLCASTHDPLTAQASFVLGALLDVGVIDGTALALPGDHQDRCVALSDLLLQASLEFGSETMLNAALQLMHQSGQDVSLQVCKKMCVVQCRAERRAMDWAYKSALPRRKQKSRRASSKKADTALAAVSAHPHPTHAAHQPIASPPADSHTTEE